MTIVLKASTGDVDTVEKVNAVGAYYGVGLEGWLSENWSSSIDVFSTGFSTVTTENDNSTSTSTVNAFDPNFGNTVALVFLICIHTFFKSQKHTSS